MISVIGLPFDATLSAVSITAGSAATNHPATQLQDTWIGHTWRSVGLNWGATLLEIDIAGTQDTVSVWLPANYSKDAQVRLRIHNTAMPVREDIVPNAAPTLVGCAGAETDIDDDPEAVDANAIVSDTDVASTADCPVSTPATVPQTGTNLQLVQVTMKGAPSDSIIVDKVEIKDGGSIKSTTTFTDTLAAATSKVYHVYWDAGDLDTADGSAVTIKVYWSGGASSSGLGRLQAVRWRALTDAAMFEGAWKEIWPSDLLGVWPTGTGPISVSIHPATLRDITGCFADHNTSGGIIQPFTNARRVQLEIRDHDNVDGYIEAGRMPVTPSVLINDTEPTKEIFMREVRWSIQYIDGIAHRQVVLPLFHLAEDNMSQLLLKDMRGIQPQFGVHMLPTSDTDKLTPFDLPMWCSSPSRLEGARLAAQAGRRFSTSLVARELRA